MSGLTYANTFNLSLLIGTLILSVTTLAKDASATCERGLTQDTHSIPYNSSLILPPRPEFEEIVTRVRTQLDTEGSEGWKRSQEELSLDLLEDETRALFHAYWEDPNDLTLHTALTSALLSGAFRDYHQILDDTQIEGFATPLPLLIPQEDGSLRLHPEIENRIYDLIFESSEPGDSGVAVSYQSLKRLTQNLSRYPESLRVFWAIPLRGPQFSGSEPHFDHSHKWALRVCNNPGSGGRYLRPFLRRSALMIYPSIFYQAFLDALFQSQAFQLRPTIYPTSLYGVTDGLELRERVIQFPHPDLDDSEYEAEGIQFGRYLFPGHDFNHAAMGSELSSRETTFRAHLSAGFKRYLTQMEMESTSDAPLIRFINSPFFNKLRIRMPDRKEIEGILRRIGDNASATTDRYDRPGGPRYRGLFTGTIDNSPSRFGGNWRGPMGLVTLAVLTLPNGRAFLTDYIEWMKSFSGRQQKEEAEILNETLTAVLQAWEATKASKN